MSYGDLTKLLIALGRRECGVASGDPALAGYTTAQVGQRANQLVADGFLFKVKFSHRSVRFFGDLARAMKAEANSALTKKNATLDNARRAAVRYAETPGGNADTTVRYSPHFKGVQQCPNYTPRFKEVDLPNIFGGNQRGRVLCESQSQEP